MKNQPAKIRAIVDAMQKKSAKMPLMAKPSRMADELANTQAMAKGRAVMNTAKNIQKRIQTRSRGKH
jgi:hypothetical protein